MDDHKSSWSGKVVTARAELMPWGYHGPNAADKSYSLLAVTAAGACFYLRLSGLPFGRYLVSNDGSFLSPRVELFLGARVNRTEGGNCTRGKEQRQRA